MASIYAGLYGKIKDKTRTVEDRLKLTKFVWKSDKVFIPNKEQILIDFLCGLLVNKKRNNITENDVRSVWKCLHDVLHTKQAHQPSKYGQTLIIKPSICQVLADSILIEYEKSCDSCLEYVIGCCHAILNSPTLSYVFKTKYDNLVKLLSSVIHLCIKSIKDNQKLLQNSVDLLDTCVSAYSKVQRGQPNQKLVLQAVSEKLLFPVLVLENVCQSLTASDEVKPCIENVKGVLQQALFDKEHLPSYEKYLQSLYGQTETRSQPPKIMENMFTVFSNLLDRKKQGQTWKYIAPDELQKVVLEYLPEFYQTFVSLKCSGSNNQTSHWLFLHLCALIGLKQESAALCGSIEESDVLLVLHTILQTVYRADVYSQAEDNAAGGVQLKVYRHVLDVLLTCNRTKGLYQSLESLLLLNHQILEPKITNVLEYTWLSGPVTNADSEVKVVLGSFLSTMVKRYAKLRHIPKWINYILTTARTCSNLKVMDLEDQFSVSFGEVIEALPQSVMIETWKKFVQEIKDHYIPELHHSDDKQRTSSLAFITSLMTLFLSRVKLADYQVTDITFEKVKELMESMETEIIVPLIDTSLQQKKNKHLLLSCLRFCHSFGDLQLLLVEHTKYEGSSMEIKPGLIEGRLQDLSYFHPNIPQEKWKKLYKMVDQIDDRRISYMSSLLSLQIFRAMMINKCPDNQDIDPDISKLTNHLIAVLLEGVDEGDRTASWDGKINSIRTENYSAVCMSHVLKILPLCAKFIDNENAHKLTDLMVQRSFHERENKSLKDKQNTLCSSLCVRESRLLQSSVISSSFTLVQSAVIPRNKQSAKKKKLSPFMTLTKEAFDVICDENVNWSDDIDELKVQRLKDGSEKICQLITYDKAELSCSFNEQHLVCLQHLSSLPLEELTPAERIRCLLGLLLMQILLEKNKASLDCLPLQIEQGVQLMSVIIENSAHTPVFQIIDVELYLQWLSKLHKSCKMLQMSVQHNVELLMEISCKMMVTDFQVLLSLGKYLNKLKMTIHTLKSGVCIEEFSPLMFAAFFMENFIRILKRTGLSEDVKSFAEENLVKLTEELDHVISTHHKGNLKLTPVLVQCYASVMESWLIMSIKSEVTENQRQNVNLIIESSIECMQKEKNKCDSDELMECLHFLYVICKHHNQFPDLMQAQHKQTLWIGLTRLLTQILTSNHSVSTESEKETITSSSKVQTMDTDIIRYLLESNLTSNKVDTDQYGLHYLSQKQTCQDEFELKSYTEQNWSTLKQKLKFEGRFEMEKNKVTWNLLQQVMGSFVASCDIQQFQNIIDKLIADTDSEHLGIGQASRLQSACYIWDKMIQYELSEEQGRIVVRGVQNLMLNYQAVMLQVKDLRDDSVILGIVLPILKSQTKMLEYGPMLMSPQTAVGALHGCQYCCMSGQFSVAVFHAVYSVLNALLVYHTTATLDVIPNLLKCADRLMKTVIQEGRQEKLIGFPKMAEDIVGCAQLIDRLFALISTHRAEFSRVSSCIVANYVSEVQQVTLLPTVKRAIIPAVYHILDICDKHAIAQLHTVLNIGVKEVFKVLYSDYLKYHKYTGKV